MTRRSEIFSCSIQLLLLLPLFVFIAVLLLFWHADWNYRKIDLLEHVIAIRSAREQTTSTHTQTHTLTIDIIEYTRMYKQRNGIIIEIGQKCIIADVSNSHNKPHSFALIIICTYVHIDNCKIIIVNDMTNMCVRAKKIYYFYKLHCYH